LVQGHAATDTSAERAELGDLVLTTKEHPEGEAKTQTFQGLQRQAIQEALEGLLLLEMLSV